MIALQSVPDTFDESSESVLPEQRLMMATIANAVADALGNGSISNKPARERARVEALEWFHRAGSDFRHVCQLAGLDPYHVRKCVLEFVSSGKPMPRSARVTNACTALPRSSVNMAEVAQVAGVSVSTVRKVVGGKGSVSSGYRKRVANALAELEAMREAA